MRVSFYKIASKLYAKIRILILKIYHKLILGRNRWRIIKRSGLYYCVQYEYSSKRVIFHGIAEAGKLNAFTELARQFDPEIHIDCGAHVGTHLLPVVAAGLAGKYYAIEGSGDTFAALQKNIKLNGFTDRVKVLNKILSDKEKEVIFCSRNKHMTGSAGIETTLADRYLATMNKKVAARATTLDSLVDFRNRRISLKIDVEGHELSVLKGARQLLTQNQVLMQIEILKYNIAYLNWLFAHGFIMIRSVGYDYYMRNFGEV